MRLVSPRFSPVINERGRRRLQLSRIHGNTAEQSAVFHIRELPGYSVLFDTDRRLAEYRRSGRVPGLAVDGEVHFWVYQRERVCV